MAERTNALVLKTRGGKTPVGSNPTAPVPIRHATDFNGYFASKVLKIVKIMETFAFWFCTLWVPSRDGGGSAGCLENGVEEGGLDEESVIPGYGRSPAHAGTRARCDGAGDHHDGRRDPDGRWWRRRHDHDG